MKFWGCNVSERQKPRFRVAEWHGDGLWTVLALYLEFQGLEVLSERLIAELGARGWPVDDLKWAASQGARFSRKRQSIVFPPEIEIVPGEK